MKRYLVFKSILVDHHFLYWSSGANHSMAQRTLVLASPTYLWCSRSIFVMLPAMVCLNPIWAYPLTVFLPLLNQIYHIWAMVFLDQQRCKVLQKIGIEEWFVWNTYKMAHIKVNKDGISKRSNFRKINYRLQMS